MPRRPLSSSVSSNPDIDTQTAGQRRGWLRNTIGRRIARAISAGVSSAQTGGVHGYGVEQLEIRRLLTTFQDPAAVQNPSPNPYFYFSGQGQIVEIAYHDVTFEAVGVSVNTSTGVATAGDLAQANFVKEPTLGANLYQIYVTQSEADSYIAITVVTVSATGVITEDPFGGSTPGFEAQNAQSGNAFAVAAPGPGGVLIGALDPVPTPGPIPIRSVAFNGLGIEPAPASQRLTPGIQVLPTNASTGEPNDFGQFFVGGTVTGTVNFGGNLTEFYAGSVLTGDIDGDLADPDSIGVRNDPGNFTVAGDLREMVVGGSFGTSGALQTAADPSSFNYVTSSDLVVGGKLGELHVYGSLAATVEVGNSPYISGQTAYPTTSASNLIGSYADTNEVEAPPPEAPDQNFTGGGVDPASGEAIPPSLDAGEFSNNALTGAQILGATPVLNPDTGLPDRNIDGNIVYNATVDGIIDNVSPATDNVDTYAVAMMAGQTFTATVTGSELAGGASTTSTSLGSSSDFSELVKLAVFDPDGREVATNSRSGDGPLQITADRPGLYRFQVSAFANPSVTELEAFDYKLTVGNVGNLGIGAIHVGGNYNDIGVDEGIINGNGDLGAIEVDGAYTSTTEGPTLANGSSGIGTPPEHAPASIYVADGDLRDLLGGSIGALINGAFGDGPYLSIPNGNVGLIESTGIVATTDILVVYGQYDPNYLDLPTPVYKTDDAEAEAIGGSIQEINSATTLYAEIATNAGIGTIDAANMDTLVPSHIDVNADNVGDDGIIDLIDVPGQFGVLGGGPEFVTNTGGNIRYMELGGTVYLPLAFGGQQDQPTTYAAGATDSFTDDSGVRYTISADGPLTTTTVNNSTGTTTQQSTGTQFTVLTYPVLDKTGLVPVSITSVASGNNSAGSLTISAVGTSGANSEIDIATISITGQGRPITTASTNSSTGVVTTTTDANGNSQIVQTVPTGDPAGVVSGTFSDPTDEFLSLTGPAKVNVLTIDATVLQPYISTNSPVEIANTTRGEVVNIDAPAGIGSIIVNGNLGFATPQATASAVLPSEVITNGNSYPFVQQHTGVVIGTGFLIGGSSTATTGDCVSISVGGAVGNVQAGGTIQSLIANSAASTGITGVTPIASQINGIVGPIVATRLLYVDVGQGLLPSGSGSVGLSGLFATGKIGTVTNTGNPNGDIRGNIVSAEDDAATNVGIDAISLVNASIIGSTIITIDDLPGHIPNFAGSEDLAGTTVVKDNNTSFGPGATTLVYDIGPITVSGRGGIIGAQVSTGSIAAVNVVNGGFGVFETILDGQATGALGGMSVSGYGIRDTDAFGFGFFGPISATGNGSLIPVTNYPLDVRPSDVPNTLESYFGVTPGVQNDINAVLGTTALQPNLANHTDTGVLEDDVFSGVNSLASLTAQKARTSLPLVTENTLPLPDVLNIPMLGQVFANSFTFGGAIGSIHIRQETDGLQISAGQIGGLSLSSSVNRLGISVAGSISALSINGNLGQYIADPESGDLIPDSYINADGSSGTIGMLRVIGNLNANVSAAASIGSILVTGDLLGNVVAYGKSNGLALGSLRVFGSIRNGSLTINGNVGSIVINSSLGIANGSLSIAGNVNLISVGAAHSLHGSQLALNLNVTGTLKSLVVYGSITGTVHTGLDLTKLTVTNDGTTPYAIAGNINIDGRLGSAVITNGSLASQFVVTGNIGSFTINRGNLNAGASLTSQVGVVNSFRIIGGKSYGLYGSLLAVESTNGSIDISGNLGDGVNAAVITSFTGKSLRVRGNVTATASVTYGSYLNLLQVDGGVVAGAVITAHPIKKQKITGADAGTIVAV